MQKCYCGQQLGENGKEDGWEGLDICDHDFENTLFFSLLVHWKAYTIIFWQMWEDILGFELRSARIVFHICQKNNCICFSVNKWLKKRSVFKIIYSCCVVNIGKTLLIAKGSFVFAKIRCAKNAHRTFQPNGIFNIYMSKRISAWWESNLRASLKPLNTTMSWCSRGVSGGLSLQPHKAEWRQPLRCRNYSPSLQVKQHV